jgi:N-acetyl-alpha-D-glucosaminyl L-malate synthase BshA
MVAYASLGGSGIVATELAQRLARRGHEVWLFATERPFRFDERSGVRFWKVDMPYYPVFPGPLYELALAGALERAMREVGLEAIHTHYAIPHAAAAWLASEGHIPNIHTLHGSDVSILGQDGVYRNVTAKFLRRACAVTAVSWNLALRARWAFGVRPRVIYNAVDVERFRPFPERRGEYAAADEYLLVHASNFRSVKRVPDIVRAFFKIRQRVKARLVLLGKGPEEAEARRVVEELNLGRYVSFLPPNPHPEHVLGAADLFLLMSEEESFGQAALEALACGVPVVSTRVGGIPELITPAVGRLVELGDLEAYASAAVELLTSDEFPRMRQVARQYAAEHFHPDHITAQYEAVYEEALVAR